MPIIQYTITFFNNILEYAYELATVCIAHNRCKMY